MSHNKTERTATLEDGLEAFRRCRNIIKKGFGGQYLSALQNMCAQRQALVEERRRVATLAETTTDPMHPNQVLVGPSPGCSGVLALFGTNSPCEPTRRSTYWLLDMLIAQHEQDITAIVGQLHLSTTQLTTTSTKLSHIACSSNLWADSGCSYAIPVVTTALLSMARVASEVRVWSLRVLADLRERLANPVYDGVQVAVESCDWWESLQPVDADKAWQAACDCYLTDVARILCDTSTLDAQDDRTE